MSHQENRCVSLFSFSPSFTLLPKCLLAETTAGDVPVAEGIRPIIWGTCPLPAPAITWCSCIRSPRKKVAVRILHFVSLPQCQTFCGRVPKSIETKCWCHLTFWDIFSSFRKRVMFNHCGQWLSLYPDSSPIFFFFANSISENIFHGCFKFFQSWDDSPCVTGLIGKLRGGSF